MVYGSNNEFNLTTLMHDIEVIDNGTRFHKCSKDFFTNVDALTNDKNIKMSRQVFNLSFLI